MDVSNSRNREQCSQARAAVVWAPLRAQPEEDCTTDLNRREWLLQTIRPAKASEEDDSTVDELTSVCVSSFVGVFSDAKYNRADTLCYRHGLCSKLLLSELRSSAS